MRTTEEVTQEVLKRANKKELELLHKKIKYLSILCGFLGLVVLVLLCIIIL